MRATLRGRAWKFGDNVNTDGIIPAKYAIYTRPEDLGPHALEGTRPGWAQQVRPGDLVVAGTNFGCGSSREIAPVAMQGAGVAGVVAASFARIFFRNAINIGLPIFESEEAAAGIQEGDELELDQEKGEVRNLTRGEVYRATALPPFIQQLIEAGGLKNYVRRRLQESGAAPPAG